MAFTLELNFDPQTEAKAIATWGRLAERGISTSMLDNRARPHVTPSVAQELDGEQFLEWIDQFSAQVPPFDVLIQAIGVFPTTEGVVYLTPTASRTLLELHTALHQAQPPSWRLLNLYYLPER